MDKLSERNYETDEETQFKFFEAVKNENLIEIKNYFKNESLKVWLLKEEEEYTGKSNKIEKILFNRIYSFTPCCIYEPYSSSLYNYRRNANKIRHRSKTRNQKMGQ